MNFYLSKIADDWLKRQAYIVGLNLTEFKVDL
jgi:hypothetical protein